MIQLWIKLGHHTAGTRLSIYNPLLPFGLFGHPYPGSQQEELGLLLGDTVGRMVLELVILHRNVESVAWNVPAVASQGVK